jgi:hypothetical protein
MIAEKPVSPWEGHQGDVETLAYALNGKMLVSSARSDMRYYLWDTVTGKELIELEEKHATANVGCTDRQADRASARRPRRDDRRARVLPIG